MTDKELNCYKACELVRELERSMETMPAFDDDAIRIILEEMRVLNQFIEEAMNTTYHPVTNNFLPAVKVRQAALERNKRCLLAYQWNRFQKLRQMRWDFGNVLPADIKSNLNPTELLWFNEYSKSLAKYMMSVGGENGLNLIQDFQPPKDVNVEVRCVTDYGKLELDCGLVIILNKDTQHLIPRAKAEPLIRKGILVQVEE